MSIQNFSNIVVFDERGYEVELQRLFNFEFKISFATRIPFYVVREPNLCVVGNADLENPQYEIIVNEAGIFRPKESGWSDAFFNGEEEKQSKYVDFELIYHAKNGTSYTLSESRGLTKDMIEFEFETVDIFGEDKNEKVSTEYKIKNVTVTEEFNNLVHKFLYGSNIANKTKEIKVPGVAEKVGAENLFPFYNFIASYKQEPVSTELVSATTFFILNSSIVDDRPTYESIYNENFDLVFSFQSNSEASFINNDKSIDEITWTKTNIVSLPSTKEEIPESEYPVPTAFSIGFSSNEEGCLKIFYMFMLVQKKTIKKYFI